MLSVGDPLKKPFTSENPQISLCKCFSVIAGQTPPVRLRGTSLSASCVFASGSILSIAPEPNVHDSVASECMLYKRSSLVRHSHTVRAGNHGLVMRFSPNSHTLPVHSDHCFVRHTQYHHINVTTYHERLELKFGT